MEMFYTVVIIIATVILILILTIIGIILSQKNNAQVYPPSKNTCPDYWTAHDNSGNITCIINDKNKGIIDISNNSYKLTTDKNLPTIDNTMIFTPGFNSSNNSINFNDSLWATSYGKTQECALNKWTNQNKISWDGISNFNGC